MISGTRNVRRIIAAAALCAGKSVVAVSAIPVGPAHAAGSDTVRSADSGGISIMANNCGLRTSAYPNSWWVLSLAAERCGECPTLARSYEASEPHGPWDFYCTYNPTSATVDRRRSFAWACCGTAASGEAPQVGDDRRGQVGCGGGRADGP